MTTLSANNYEIRQVGLHNERKKFAVKQNVKDNFS